MTPVPRSPRRRPAHPPTRGIHRRVLLPLLLALHGGASAFGVEAPAAPASGAPAAAAIGLSPERERLGEELFGRNCQLCHNSRGKGGKAPALVRGVWAPGGANSDEDMARIIREGRPNTQMGGFGGALSEDEIRTIVAFLRAEARRVQAAGRKAVETDHQPW